MKRLLSVLPLSLCLALPASASPDLTRIIKNYVTEQTRAYPGQVTITVGDLDPRMRLPACERYQPYTLKGSKMLGSTTVGLRCLSPNRWNIFVPVKVAVETPYVASANTLMPGKALQPSDLMVLTGDLGTLPTGVLTDPEQALGKTLRYGIASGQPLRQDQLAAPIVIQQGQSVTLIFQGAGFTATNEGRAIANASEGQTVQVRTQSGLVVSGIAQANGTVQVGPTPP